MCSSHRLKHYYEPHYGDIRILIYNYHEPHWSGVVKMLIKRSKDFFPFVVDPKSFHIIVINGAMIEGFARPAPLMLVLPQLDFLSIRY